MEKKNVKDILEKVGSGEFTPEEEAVAKRWLFQLNREAETDLSADQIGLSKKKVWENVLASRPPVRKARLWPRMVIAAAVMIVIFGAGLFFYQQYRKNDSQAAVASNDVGPGKMGATLTLASGKKIRLSEAANGELAKEAGVVVSKAADGQLVYEIKNSEEENNKLNTLSTTNGETYRLRLPDGSLVWLNAASSITYSAGLIENGKRSVALTGEGYFEVAKDRDHPFVVNTNGQQVEVLGTHFNINSYGDEPVVRTTLLEGKVDVRTPSAHAVLAPGEQSQTGTSGRVRVNAIDTELAVAWKNNQFIFENDDVQYIMRMLERWYNVKVVYKGEPPTEKLGGAVSRFENISSVLRILEMTGGAKFKVEGRTVYVSR